MCVYIYIYIYTNIFIKKKKIRGASQLMPPSLTMRATAMRIYMQGFFHQVVIGHPHNGLSFKQKHFYLLCNKCLA